MTRIKPYAAYPRICCRFCGRKEAEPDRSRENPNSVGACARCANNIRGMMMGVRSSIITEEDAAKDLLARRLDMLARAERRGRLPTNCEAISLDPPYQCPRLAVTYRSGHPVCQTHANTHRELRYIGDPPALHPYSLLILEIFNLDPKIEEEVWSYRERNA